MVLLLLIDCLLLLPVFVGVLCLFIILWCGTYCSFWVVGWSVVCDCGIFWSYSLAYEYDTLYNTFVSTLVYFEEVKSSFDLFYCLT